MMKDVCMVDVVRGCYVFRALVLQCQIETCEDGPNDMCFRFIFFSIIDSHELEECLNHFRSHVSSRLRIGG